MKELQGILKFRVIKQRAPKSGIDVEEDEDDVIISHLINPEINIKYMDNQTD